MITRHGAAGSSAVFSDDEEYRYRLDRTWDAEVPGVTWIMLNPSTASEAADDATIRRCTGFARSWGYGGISVVNLYALRARNPKSLRGHHDPVGPGNDEFIAMAAHQGGIVIAAWGANVVYPHRAPQVLRLAGQPVYCLGTTSKGHPRHPLYAPSRLSAALYDPLAPTTIPERGASDAAAG